MLQKNNVQQVKNEQKRWQKQVQRNNKEEWKVNLHGALNQFQITIARNRWRNFFCNIPCPPNVLVTTESNSGVKQFWLYC
jgi:hypothetical protein